MICEHGVNEETSFWWINNYDDNLLNIYGLPGVNISALITRVETVTEKVSVAESI